MKRRPRRLLVWWCGARGGRQASQHSAHSPAAAAACFTHPPPPPPPPSLPRAQAPRPACACFTPSWRLIWPRSPSLTRWAPPRWVPSWLGGWVGGQAGRLLAAGRRRVCRARQGEGGAAGLLGVQTLQGLDHAAPEGGEPEGGGGKRIHPGPRPSPCAPSALPLQEDILALAMWHAPRGRWCPLEVARVSLGGAKKGKAAGAGTTVTITIASLPGVRCTSGGLLWVCGCRLAAGRLPLRTGHAHAAEAAATVGSLPASHHL